MLCEIQSQHEAHLRLVTREVNDLFMCLLLAKCFFTWPGNVCKHEWIAGTALESTQVHTDGFGHDCKTRPQATRRTTGDMITSTKYTTVLCTKYCALHYRIIVIGCTGSHHLQHNFSQNNCISLSVIYVFVNSILTSAAYMRQWIMWASVKIMACRLFGTKPLSKPILCYCQLYP